VILPTKKRRREPGRDGANHTHNRHAGLDPASTFFFFLDRRIKGRWTPDQVRGDAFPFSRVSATRVEVLLRPDQTLNRISLIASELLT
jgi:hypothetical protein